MKEDWVECKLEDVLTRMSNGSSAKQFNEKIGYPISRIETIWNETIDLNRVKYIKESSDEIVEKYALKKNDILLSHINSDSHLGKTAIFKSDTKVLIHGINLLLLRPTVHISAFFLLYQLRFLRVQGAFLDIASRSVNQSSVNQRKLNKVDLILPPLPIQRAIVSKIETLFSDLDKGIADLKKAQEQLKIYRQAVLKKAFEGELTREWRGVNKVESSYDFLRKISEDRKGKKTGKNSIYNKKISHDFKFQKSDKIVSWAVATLDKLIYIAARIGWRGLKKSEYTENGPLFLSVHSLNYGKHVDYSEAYHLSEKRYLESPEIQIQEGDVLLCKDGAGIGKIGIVKELKNRATVNSSLLIIRGLEILNQEFLYYLFSGPALQSIVFQRITGSATPHLFQNDIRKFELQIPPIQEQHQIVREIESRLSVCDKVEQNISEALDTSEALRQSILKKAFEGKLLSPAEIEACKREADYEPASVLLERIRKERPNEK